MRERDTWLGAALAGAIVLALYSWTLAPDTLFGDPAELQTAAWIASLAHPTGYPLYLLIGWLWSHLLPWGTPAWRMNFFSAIWGAASAAVMFLAAMELARSMAQLSRPLRLTIAWATALLFAAIPTIWSQAVIAEVYTLHAFLLMSLLWLTLRPPSATTPVVMAAILGLGLAHHRTSLLWLAGTLVWAVLAWRMGRLRLCRRDVWWAVLALLLPQVLYLYVPLRAASTPYYHVPLASGAEVSLYDGSLRAFVGFVAGQAFAGSLLPPGAALARLGESIAIILANVPLPVMALALIGVAWLIMNRRWPVLGFTAVVAAGQWAFNLLYAIGDIYVLYVPLYVIVVVWAAAGALSIAGILARRWRRLAWIVPGALLLFVAGFGYATAPLVDRSEDRAARDFWMPILQAPLPQGAIVVSNDRDEIAPLIYLQVVEGRRPDVTGLYPLLLPEPGWRDVVEVIETALHSGRPVYLAKPMPGIEVRFDVSQEGTLSRVVREVDAPGEGHLGLIDDRLELVAVEADRDAIQPGEEITLILYWRVRRPLEADYTSYVHLLDANGEKVAQHDALPGGVYAPSSTWRVDDVIRDRHPIRVPEALSHGPYELMIGFYRAPEIVPLGQPLVLSWEQVIAGR
ncbi:MAG: hypothetical protein Kow0047_05570 [Anaerolineae bacterium]